MPRTVHCLVIDIGTGQYSLYFFIENYNQQIDAVGQCDMIDMNKEVTQW